MPMLSVKHKLYPTQKQTRYLSDCLWSAIGIENWVIGQIRQTTEDYFPLACMKPLQIRSILSKRIKGHSARCGLPSRLLNDCIQAVLTTVKKHGIHRTKWKAARKKNSFYYNGDIKIASDGRLKLPNLKTTLRMSEQDKFQGKLKKVVLMREVSGWYAVCVYDEDRAPIKITDSLKAGIDPGLKTALVLSDGVEYEFPRWYRDSQIMLAKLQRKSKHSKKVKRLHQLIAAKRKDHHHKLTTELAKKYQKIYWSDDGFKGLKQMKNLGKAYSDVSLGSLRDILKAKLASRADGQGELITVSNRYSTQTCSACGVLSGPKGKSGLVERSWKCIDCGTNHDRDVNAAQNTLISGQGVGRKSMELCKSLEIAA